MIKLQILFGDFSLTESSLPPSNTASLTTGCSWVGLSMTQMYQKYTVRFICDLIERVPFFVSNPRGGCFYIHAIAALHGEGSTLTRDSAYEDSTTLDEVILRCRNCVLRSRSRLLPIFSRGGTWNSLVSWSYSRRSSP